MQLLSDVLTAVSDLIGSWDPLGIAILAPVIMSLFAGILAVLKNV